MSSSALVHECLHTELDVNSVCVFCGKGFLYNSGLPFSSGSLDNANLPENLDDLQSRINSKKASLVIVDGGVGEGKTTLAVEVAEYIQKSPLNFRKQYAIGGLQFQEKLQICIDSDLHVIIYDEAGDFNSRGALTKFNQMLNRVFETYRTFKILVILVLPNFGVLDDSLFSKQIPRLLLHCSDRNDYYGNYDGYSLWRMYYIRKKMKKLTVPPHAYTLTTANFSGHFLDLMPKQSRELEAISMEGKQSILSMNIIKSRGHLSLIELSRKVQRSTRWVNQKLSKHKVEPAEIFKRVKFYKEDVVYILEKEKKDGAK